MSIFTLQWTSPTGKPSEDTFFTEETKSIFAVADGVTRRGYEGSYPNPSPARLAAQKIIDSFAELIPIMSQKSEESFKKVWTESNLRLQQLNKELGLWEKVDYWGNDFAGAVASCLIVEQQSFFYGFIGDCGVAQISRTGDLVWHTPNEVAHIEPYVLPDEAAKHTDKLLEWRKEYRNNPTANHPTYGVLTGEDEAVEYIRIGKREFSSKETLVVYSDGIEPFLYHDPDFRKLIIQGKKDQLQEYVHNRSSPENNKDEKTLIVIKQ